MDTHTLDPKTEIYMLTVKLLSEAAKLPESVEYSQENFMALHKKKIRSLKNDLKT